jgi:thiol-disulfide isomerase/thioredoxin
VYPFRIYPERNSAGLWTPGSKVNGEVSSRTAPVENPKEMSHDSREHIYGSHGFLHAAQAMGHVPCELPYLQVEGLIEQGGVGIIDLRALVSEWSNTNSPRILLNIAADWCGPCKQISPYMEELAGEYPGVIFIKVCISADVLEVGLRASLVMVVVPDRLDRLVR